MLLLLLSKPNMASAIEEVYFFMPEATNDTRLLYPKALLETALEKTRDEYGDYQIISKHTATNSRQKVHLMSSERGYVLQGVYRAEWAKKLRLIPVPLTRGLMSLRVFLIRKDSQENVANLESLEALKAIPTGSGNGWASTDVFKHHDFNVVVVPRYQTMFAMLDRGRFDMLSRGAHEIGAEYKRINADYPNLRIEETIILEMPLPVYFYVASQEERLAKRIEKGLKLMMNDGSFNGIFDEYFSDLIAALNLSKRKMFSIDNPFLPDDLPVQNGRDLIQKSE